MGEWIETTIGDQATLQRGFDITKAQQCSGDIPVVSSGGISSYHNQKMVDGPGVILGRKGVVGSVYFISNDYWPHDTTLWVKDFHGNNQRFVYYFFKWLAPRLANMDVGSANPTLNRNHVHPIEVFWPEIHLQECISDLLTTLDDKIDLNRRINETLEAMARAIFKDWFVDFGPVRAKAEGRPPYLAPDLWALFPDALDDEDKPMGWEETSISELIEIIGGGTPKTSVPEYWGGDIPWFSVVDVPNLSDVFVIDTEKYITESGLKNSSTQILPKGATIVTARGTVGKLACVAVPMTMNQSCYAIIGKPPLGSYFTYFMLKGAVQGLQANTHGSVFDTITRSTFSAVESIRPKDRLAQMFDEVVNPLMARILSNLQESQTLAQLRDLLLPKLMSGEIRLRDAEKMVEAVA